MTAAADNRLIIAGRVVEREQTRYSPAGLPIVRLVLDHQSRQIEAGYPREARCRIAVLACGEALARAAGGLAPGALVRVRGFLSRADARRGEARLVVHAELIEILDYSEPQRG
ncbi:MAG: primosomal replication protein N [Pseudomonadota bacterium]|nr:primosomal replication protein N [Pseudomonadota bacterium]